MPVIERTPYRMEPGTVVREGDNPLVVVDSEFTHPPNHLALWTHKMRAPTEDEKILSDVMQT